MESEFKKNSTLWNDMELKDWFKDKNKVDSDAGEAETCTIYNNAFSESIFSTLTVSLKILKRKKSALPVMNHSLEQNEHIFFINGSY